MTRKRTKSKKIYINIQFQKSTNLIKPLNVNETFKELHRSRLVPRDELI